MTRFLLATVLLGLAPEPLAQDIEPPPPPPREFRAAWVATVDNIDWPSRKGLPVARFTHKGRQLGMAVVED